MHNKKVDTDSDEKEMISALELGGYEVVANEKATIGRYSKIFRENGNKTRRVNIRMTEWDVEKAQAQAMREGIPYATLLTSILHKYFTGRFKEKR